MPTPVDHLEAMLALLRPEELTSLSPAQLKRLKDGLYIAHGWCELALRQIESETPKPKAGVLAQLKNGDRTP